MGRLSHKLLLLSLLAVAVCSAKGQGQHPDTFSSFEKEGRFILPEGSFSYEGPQPFDMVSYKLDVSLAMVDDGFSGKSTMVMRLKATVDSIVLNSVGLSLDTVRVDGIPRSVSFNSVGETFTIRLGSLRTTGDTLHIEIWYRRTPGYPRPNSRQGYYFFRDTIGLPANLGYTFSEPSDARFWMPCYDEPWEKATSEMNITVPTGYVAASNGKLVGTSNNGNGTITWGWRENHQITTYLMCITASCYSLSNIPYVKATGDTIPIQYYVWNAPPYIDSAVTASFLPTVKDMVTAFASRYGEYPFDKYGMTSVVPFGYLGMEHQSLTTMNRHVQTNQRVVSHELSHQWWGDNVTCGTWADIWLNEGFATYSEALWREFTDGSVALKSYMQDTLNGFQFGSWQGAIYNPVGQGFNLFDQVVYSKAGWVLHTLRGVLGDSTFFRSLAAYRQRYAGKSAITNEFKAVVDSVAGQDMGWFFNQWIFGPGWPKYASRYTWSADTLSLTVYQQQSPSWPTYKMPITVRAYHGMNNTIFSVWDTVRTQVFRLPLVSSPDSAVLDPDGWILKQIVAPTSVAEEHGQPREFQLYQNFPNPFNPTTSIRYSLPALSGAVGTLHVTSLRVYNILGQEVATLVNEMRPAGEHTISFDASNLSSGMYIYRLMYGNAILMRKMLMMK
jgi:aminopeptidase N